MYEEQSPWGEIQWTEPLISGVDLVSTAGHGGARVTREASIFLSPAARKCCIRERGCLWFEEDCDEAVVLRELMDKKLWSPPADKVKDPVAFEEGINKSLQTYHPTYWAAREKAQKRQAKTHDHPAPRR